ncbi:MAG: 3-oxoacyl-ACP reductase FabG [Spirochaetia bacterium]|nr:3-oxoacyl-ACP reductase FabG [Spirochaetia bacterium]
MNHQLKDQVALVTGGSRGIGYAIAETFAAQGAKVALVYRDEAAGQAALQKIREKVPGAVVMGKACDIAKAADVDALYELLIKEWGRLDILVNNAGITRDTLILRMKEEDWDAVMNTNLKGAFLMSKTAVKHMLKARKGAIINLSSVVGQMGNAGQVNYAASKGGLIAFTKSLAREVASRNITVNAIAPGYIETDMTESLSPEMKETLKANIPLGRLGAVSDIAQAALYLASEGATYVTGQVLAVNGGMSMA